MLNPLIDVNTLGSNTAGIMHMDLIRMTEEMRCAAEFSARPSVLLRVKVFPDGNRWCALYGDNMQGGVCGFGASPDEACAAFDAAWRAKLEPVRDALDPPTLGSLRGIAPSMTGDADSVEFVRKQRDGAALDREEVSK